MQKYEEKGKHTIDVSQIGKEDDRLRILNQIKKNKAEAALFGKAKEKYADKRWEDAWLPYYRISTGAAVVGGILSFIIGWAGCTLVATAMFGGTVGLVIGTFAAAIMEITKFFSLKYGAENMFAGRTTSGAIQLTVAAAAVVLSVYTSYQSATHSEYFRSWVMKEAGAGSTGVDAAPSLIAIEKEIAEQEAILRDIDKDRQQWASNHGAKDAKWKRADEATNAKAKIAKLEAKRDVDSREALERSQSEKNAAAAADLSWWVFLLIVLPDVIVIFGTVFCEYYEFRVYELLVVSGKSGNQEQLMVRGNKHTSYTLLDEEEDDRPKEDARLRKELSVLQQQLQELRQKQPPHHPAEQPTLPPSNGKTEMGFKRTTAEPEPTTPEDTPYSSHSSHTVETVATVATEYAEMDSESLLDSFRSLMSRKKSWERRETVTAKHNVARCDVRIEAIQSVLSGRKEGIALIDRAYKIVKRE